MKSTLVVVCALLITILPTTQLAAQNFELGIQGGATHYSGDLTDQFIVPELTQPVAGISLTYNTSPHFGISLGVNAGYLEGNDATSTEEWQQRRNLSFKTDLVEASLVGQVNFLDIEETGITPYVYAGVAGFYFNPRAEYNGDWYDLQPLGTEGQGTSAYPDRKPYSQYAFAIPFGGGLKFKLTDHFNVSVEAGIRKTFTDYIDDVSTTYANKEVLLTENGPLSVTFSDRSGEVMSEAPDRTPGAQRGNPEVNDYYGFGTIKLSIPLGTRPQHSEAYDCPMKL